MFILTLALGVTMVPAIALSPLYVDRVPPVASGRLGAALVLLAIGLVLISFGMPAPSANSRDGLFLGAFTLMLAGALLILLSGDDEPGGGPGGGGGGRPEDDPPWWPEFEAGFARYLQQRRQLAPRR
jgi:hypothetical protein